MLSVKKYRRAIPGFIQAFKRFYFHKVCRNRVLNQRALKGNLGLLFLYFYNICAGVNPVYLVQYETSVNCSLHRLGKNTNLWIYSIILHEYIYDGM